MIRLICPQCGAAFERKAGHVNRSTKVGAPLYCGMGCAGLARRLKNPPTEQQRKVAKAAYDREYRKRDPQAIKARKAAYYQRTRDPVKEAIKRKKRMHLHVAYCQRPEYRAKKSEYDKQLRAAEYGPFAEAYLLLLDLQKDIRSRMSKYERMKAKCYFTRSAQARRRELWRLMNSTRAI